MELLSSLSQLFFSCITRVISGAPYLVFLLVGAWISAMVFNLIDNLLSRS